MSENTINNNNNSNSNRNAQKKLAEKAFLNRLHASFTYFIR